MSTITIRYQLSEAGRRASLLAGGDGRAIQEAHVPLTPELLAIAHVREDGTPLIDLTAIQVSVAGATKINTWTQPLRLDDVPADPVDLALRVVPAKIDESRAAAEAELAAIRERQLEAERAERAEQSAAIDDFLGQRKRWAEYRTWPGNRVLEDGRGGRLSLCRLPDSDPRLSAAAALQEQLDRDRWAQESAREAQEAARAAARNRDRDAWIRAHGSERLQKCLDLGLVDNSEGVYLDERLAHECPGAIWLREKFEESEILNPSLEALQTLERVRNEIDTGATLTKVRRSDDPDDYDSRWIAAVKFDPGDWSDRTALLLVQQQQKRKRS